VARAAVAQPLQDLKARPHASRSAITELINRVVQRTEDSIPHFCFSSFVVSLVSIILLFAIIYAPGLAIVLSFICLVMSGWQVGGE
jgi:hypothetical protein